MKLSPLDRAFVLAFVFALSGSVFVQFVFFDWPPLFVAAVGGVTALLAALPVFEEIGAEERAALTAKLEEAVDQERTAAAAGWGDGWEGLGRLIAEGDPSTAEYAQGVELAAKISGQLKDLGHVGRARMREAELRRAL